MGKPRILLTGHAGLLGSNLAPQLAEIGDLVCPDREAFDLLRPDTILQAVQQIRPGLVVHLAAEARVDYCQENPEEAFSINARGTACLAQACRRVGARLVLMSTDYVFDGCQNEPYREYQSTGPVNVYGRTKEEAERAVLSLCHNSLVIRSSSLFGSGGRNFVTAVLEKISRGEKLRVVEDQIQSPTWAGHLGPAVARIVWSDLCGIVHLAGGGSCSWYEFACTILREAKRAGAVEPIATDESGRVAPRPAYSVLDCSLVSALADVQLPDWGEGLKAYLDGGAV